MAAIKNSSRKMLAQNIFGTNMESQFRNHFIAIIKDANVDRFRQTHSCRHIWEENISRYVRTEWFSRVYFVLPLRALRWGTTRKSHIKNIKTRKKGGNLIHSKEPVLSYPPFCCDHICRELVRLGLPDEVTNVELSGGTLTTSQFRDIAGN